MGLSLNIQFSVDYITIESTKISLKIGNAIWYVAAFKATAHVQNSSMAYNIFFYQLNMQLTKKTFFFTVKRFTVVCVKRPLYSTHRICIHIYADLVVKW